MLENTIKIFTDFEQFIYVKESQIHGTGIFTSVDIPKNKTIMIIKGETIDGYECERREETNNNVYIFWINDECYLDTAMTDKIKFINHDCNFNCEIEENDGDSLLLVADRDIKVGEELTIDYGYEEIYELCNCEKCIKNKIAI